MREFSDGTNLTITVVFVLGVGLLIYQFDQRVKKKGALFNWDGSSNSRFFALLVGLFIGSFFVLGWLVNFPLYPLLLLSLALIGYGFRFDRLLELYQPKKMQSHVNDIVGIEWMTKDELAMQVQAGAKFVVFEFCVSVFFFAAKRTSQVYFIKPHESHLSYRVGYTAISLLSGWMSPMLLYQTIRTNLTGGRDVTQKVLAFYDNPGTNLQLELL